jgi:hypothetical protein
LAVGGVGALEGGQEEGLFGHGRPRVRVAVYRDLRKRGRRPLKDFENYGRAGWVKEMEMRAVAGEKAASLGPVSFDRSGLDLP